MIMYTISKCRNCGEIQPMNKIGELCPICGEFFTEEQSMVDYNTLLDNDNIFNENFDLFYSNYIPFENDTNVNKLEDYENFTVIILYKTFHRDLVVTSPNIDYPLNNYFKFDGVIISYCGKFFRIFINQFPSGNTENTKKVELKEISLKNIDKNTYVRMFNISLFERPLISEIKWDKKYDELYEMDYLEHLKILDPSKVNEYICMNRVISILRNIGIPFIEEKEGFLCNLDTFISHPNIKDVTKEFSTLNGDYYINSYDYEKVPLKFTNFYIFSKDKEKNQSIDPYNANIFEELFINNFVKNNNIEDFEDLYDYFMNNSQILVSFTNDDNIEDISSILKSHHYKQSQYCIYKILKNLGYKKVYLDFRYHIYPNEELDYKNIFFFTLLETDDGKFIQFFNSNNINTAFRIDELKGINIFDSFESYNKFINAVMEKYGISINKSFLYSGNYIINSGMSVYEFFMSCINDSKNCSENILKEDVNSNNFKKVRKEICEKIYTVMSILDKTGSNTKKYQELFELMSDEEFDRYMKNFLKDEDKNFYLEVLPNKNEPSLKQIKSALEYLNVPMDEYLYYRHDGNKSNPLRTRYKVPVGFIHLKRLQQMLQKKNTFSTSIDKRSLKTNQVTGEDKIARISDAENYSLSAIGADFALKEFLGPRADGEDSKLEFYKSINNDGYVYLDNLPNDISKKQTLNTLNTFLLGAGIASDLITEDFIAVKSNTKNINKLL